MKVLHIFNEIKYSGGEIMYANAAVNFQNEGFILCALSTGNDVGDFASVFEKNGIAVYHKPLPNNSYNPLKLFRYFKNISDFIKKENIDIIHIHRASYFWFFSLVGFINKVKTIRTVHNVFKNRVITWPKAYLERLTARKILKITFQTIGESVYLNELNYYKNPSKKINNWYDDKKFFPSDFSSEKENFRKKLNIPKECFVIISVGGCSKIKNHHDIIKALALLSGSVDLFYLHLGTGHTEEEEINLAQSLNVVNSINFLGNKDNVRDYLISSDLFVMPSKFEGLGNAAIEAMACAVPCILYNSPGLRDLIKEEKYGFLIEHDFNILAGEIKKLMYNDTLRVEMGKNAHEFVKQNFSISKSVQEMIQLYRS